MTLTYRIATSTIKHLLRLLCRVDGQELARVPERGPLIVVTNHVSFLEVPLIYTQLEPRPMDSFAKVETWDNPLLGWLASLWGAIPIRRGEADTAALRQALEALEAGHILFVAPEGTRSGDGRLQPGKPGVVLLAQRSGAPVLPLVHYGGELFWVNFKRLRRTPFHIRVGRPFTVDAGGVKVTGAVRQQMTDEIMAQMAALLPPAYRGVYSELVGSPPAFLRFPPGTERQHNVPRVADG